MISANWRTKFTFFILIGVFVSPLVLATYFYFQDTFQGHITTNHGQLIQPPITLEQLGLKKYQGHWLLLVYNPEQCGELCLNNLYKMRQVRVALGKDRNRVERVLIDYRPNQSLQAKLANQYRGTALASGDPDAINRNLRAGYLYIVDPLGNLMMGYGPNAQAEGLFEDLKKLLKVSQIG